MQKIKSNRYKYKFAHISKERSILGEAVWRCQLTNAFRVFPSRRDAKRYVDDVEVNLARQWPRGDNHPPCPTRCEAQKLESNNLI